MDTLDKVADHPVSRYCGVQDLVALCHSGRLNFVQTAHNHHESCRFSPRPVPDARRRRSVGTNDMDTGGYAKKPWKGY